MPSTARVLGGAAWFHISARFTACIDDTADGTRGCRARRWMGQNLRSLVLRCNLRWLGKNAQCVVLSQNQSRAWWVERNQDRAYSRFFCFSPSWCQMCRDGGQDELLFSHDPFPWSLLDKAGKSSGWCAPLGRTGGTPGRQFAGRSFAYVWATSTAITIGSRCCCFASDQLITGSSVLWGAVLRAVQPTFHPFQASTIDPRCICSQADSWAQRWDIAGGCRCWFWMVGGEPFAAVALHCFLFAVPGLDHRPPERPAPVSVSQSQVETVETHPAALWGIFWHWRQALRLQSCNAAVIHSDATGLWKAPNHGWPCVLCIPFSSEAFRCIRKMLLDFYGFPVFEQYLSIDFVGLPFCEAGAAWCCHDGCSSWYCLHQHIPHHHLAGHPRTTAGPSHFRKFWGWGFGQLPSRVGPGICIPSRLFWFLCCLLFTCTCLHRLPCLGAERSTDILEEFAKLTELCFPVAAEPIEIFLLKEIPDLLQSVAFLLHWFHFMLFLQFSIHRGSATCWHNLSCEYLESPQHICTEEASCCSQLYCTCCTLLCVLKHTPLLKLLFPSINSFAISAKGVPGLLKGSTS